MKQIREYEQDIASIRSMMDRSAKFISLSGLSGVLAGIYALIGAAVTFTIRDFNFKTDSLSHSVIVKLLLIAAAVLVASLATGFWLSGRKAKKAGGKLWTPASKTMMFNLSIPLITGGIFILIMLYSGHFGLASPACLIFYGLALIQGSANTVDEVRYLGYSEIILGLLCALQPGYGLIFWAVGFGILHIVYGGIMYNKYDT